MTGLQDRVRELARRHRVPGVSVALLRDDHVEEAVAGVVNRATRVRTTPDSLFQIGSIAKVYTATLVMLLVDEDAVDLDAPVRTYVPELELGDEQAEATITVRQLLSHTSGIQGDYFADFGRGDDCVERYVASLGEIGTIFPPGAMWSYSNAGYVLAGRLIEKITEMSWDDALRDKLLGPAGLKEHASLPEDAIFFRAAVGHEAKTPRGRQQPVAPWLLPRSSSPAGATLCASARDLIRFAKLHLDEGRADNGAQILSPSSVKAMQEEQVLFPGEVDTSMGLGWVLHNWSGTKILWHSGGTLGQLAFVYVIPEHRFAVSALTNSRASGQLIDDLCKELFRELGVEAPEDPRLPEDDPEIDLTVYAGRYERYGVRIDVEPVERHLKITEDVSIIPGQVEDNETMIARPVDASDFLVIDEKGEVQGKTTFLEFGDDGRPRYMFLGRVLRRVV
ncbi:MAG TPA: serine hydrolase domain-containing protein [Actinomycetota bacterium]|jgi:CubicO group peptidase (beta-lactamase class C family)|nr:serine hydrolase domain-containing protein [Actinomycetota bacterium]